VRVFFWFFRCFFCFFRIFFTPDSRENWSSTLHFFPIFYAKTRSGLHFDTKNDSKPLKLALKRHFFLRRYRMAGGDPCADLYLTPALDQFSAQIPFKKQCGGVVVAVADLEACWGVRRDNGLGYGLWGVVFWSFGVFLI
jgi:hypothetical protein